jgi:hypothetical protein
MLYCCVSRNRAVAFFVSVGTESWHVACPYESSTFRISTLVILSAFPC